MRILHLADLHLGKKVNDFCMLNEQKFVLSQAVDLIKNEQIEAILIAGDVFDKPIPSIASLELFEEFLAELNKLNVSIFIISGNHDNMDRLSYLSGFLEKSKVYISKGFDGKIQKIELNSDVNIFLMPYLYPALVGKYYPDLKIKTYNDAIKLVIDDIKIDKNKVNILLAHQFVIGKNNPELSQSEQKSVGGIDEIDYKIFKKFSYVALGHLHCPQKCGSEFVRYSGSILKYSFSEINQNKKFLILNIENNKIDFIFKDIKFLHEMKQYCGFIDEFLDENFYKNIKTDDYIHFILKDECVLDAKKKLNLIYPNIMLLEFDNSFTRNINAGDCADIKSDKTLFEHFCDFYKMQTNTELDETKKDYVLKILQEDNNCVL